MGYDEQLSAAKFRAERDLARQDLVIERFKRQRIGRTVWRLQNRLSRAHRRERQLRKGLRMWREKAIEKPQVTMSAYDLLPEEEREALRWVRGHGGLDEVCRDFQDAYNRRSELCAALGIDLDSGWSDAMAELDRRLMPEGYEWPRYETGELLRYKDRYIQDGAESEVWHVDFDSYGDVTILNSDCSKCSLDKGERVKRPCKVLDADGAEIELGDDLYSVEGNLKFHVSHVDRANGKIATDAMFAIDKWADPSLFTHRAPVIAADGKPLEVGQAVWDWNGDGYVVDRIYSGTTEPDFPGHTVACRRSDDIVTHMFKPSQLTHQRPVLDADGVQIKGGDTIYRDSATAH